MRKIQGKKHKKGTCKIFVKKKNKINRLEIALIVSLYYTSLMTFIMV